MAENSPRTGEDAHRQTEPPHNQPSPLEQTNVNRDQLLLEATELVVRGRSMPDLFKEFAHPHSQPHRLRLPEIRPLRSASELHDHPLLEGTRGQRTVRRACG